LSPFWPLEHTADAGLLVRAPSLAGLFVEAAKGLVCLLLHEVVLRPTGRRDLELEAPERDLLLADFLSEILYLASAEGLVTLNVEMVEFEPTRLKARLGVKSARDLGGLKTEIKAVTYHGLKIEETEEGFEAKVIFDV